ncbi:MAG: hypothetical protein ACHQZR_02160 [Candidatus Limnocylindrales bacterium]
MANVAIVHDLAFVNWLVVFSLAAGSAAAAVLGRLFSEATRGYLVFMAVTASVLGLVTWLADGALPPSTDLAVPPDPSFDTVRTTALAAFSGLALAYAVALARGRRAALLGGAVLFAGAVAMVAAAMGWAGGVAAGVPAVVLFLLLAGVGGGTFAAMVLGHWYLVTPHLGERALVQATRLLVWLLTLRLICFGLWTALGTGPDGRPFGALVGSSAIFVWLLLGIGLVFPLAVMAMANRTARTRSMESATGLLYIATAAVLAATIVAGGLFFGAGLLA